MVHSGDHACHWCEQEFQTIAGIKRTVHKDYRRFLPEDHDLREDHTYGAPEFRGPPEPRTDTNLKAAGYAADEYDGPKKNHPKHNTGVRRSCALYYVPMFDMVFDICLDYMHVVKNFIIKTLKLLKGVRAPKRPGALKSKENDTPAQRTKKTKYVISL